VDGLDLEIRRGECFGLLGRTAREDDDDRDAGRADASRRRRDLGPRRPVDGDERALRERLGVSLQETQLADKLTVFETLVLFRSFFRRGHDPEELSRASPLRESPAPWSGSSRGGQRQRLAVACALVGEPEFLSSTSRPRASTPRAGCSSGREIRASGRRRTILLTTHYMDEAERLCDRIAIVDHGKVIELGTPPN